MRGGNGTQYRQHELLLVRLQQEEKHQRPRFAGHHDRCYGGYSKASGTSMAAPIVSGVFALLFAAEPVATVDDACRAIYLTATPIQDPENDRTKTSGSKGVVDAEKAVKHLWDLGRTAYPDVSPGDWFFDAAYSMKARGAMTGDGVTGMFNPYKPMTRAMIAQVMYNMNAPSVISPSCNKPDVDQNEWYTKAINWCVDRRIMTGYDDGSNLFGTNDTITREQMCKVVFSRSYSNLADASREKYDKLLGTEQTSDWAVPYVIWAVDRGVINGIDNHDGTYSLDPQGELTRCQAAQVFVNSINAGIM